MKKRMIAAAGGLLVVGAGCGTLPSSGAYWQYRSDKLWTQDTGTAHSSADRMHTHRQVADTDARTLVDDIDYIFLTDRPSRLSRYHDR
jgi:hypothetical protein